jgi:3-deoxy-D-manno-octulosonic-acid transferase
MQARAMQQIGDASELVKAIGLFYENPSARDAQVARATAALEASQGAVARHIKAMAPYWG